MTAYIKRPPRLAVKISMHHSNFRLGGPIFQNQSPFLCLKRQSVPSQLNVKESSL